MLPSPSCSTPFSPAISTWNSVPEVPPRQPGGHGCLVLLRYQVWTGMSWLEALMDKDVTEDLEESRINWSLPRPHTRVCSMSSLCQGRPWIPTKSLTRREIPLGQQRTLHQEGKLGWCSPVAVCPINALLLRISIRLMLLERSFFPGILTLARLYSKAGTFGTSKVGKAGGQSAGVWQLWEGQGKLSKQTSWKLPNRKMTCFRELGTANPYYC